MRSIGGFPFLKGFFLFTAEMELLQNMETLWNGSTSWLYGTPKNTRLMMKPL